MHPGFPTSPYVYALYTYDGDIGGPRAALGTHGPAPHHPAPTGDGCVVSGRLATLTPPGNLMTAEQVLIHDWCQQYPSHTVGDLAFGADGALYVTGGDGASFNFTDYGQDGSPVNPCSDPPGGRAAPTPPSAEGGALRTQDMRTTADPASLDGTVMRLNPITGAAARQPRGGPATPTPAASSPPACETRSG